MIAAAGLVTYGNTFSAPFVFDDLPAIRDNATIRQLGAALSPPHASGLPVGGRPIVNFSLGLNYALSGTAVWSYHVVNLVIHVLAALTLFGIVRRTLAFVKTYERDGELATRVALFAALLWELHPLQTESVTYLVQRAESLMGLFYLLTLYAFIRGAENGASRAWHVTAIISCALGMATKEVMASAPLIVLLYDRTFVSGTLREAWRRHAKLYCGLAATWLLLGWLVLGTQGRGGTAGFATEIKWWDYATAQGPAILRYVGLALWPQGLTLDYGSELANGNLLAMSGDVVVFGLAVGCAVALWRRRAMGFLGVWFFAILAPSSSVVPIATQAVAEHRMYLSLAAIVVLIVLAVQRGLGKWTTLALAVVVLALAFRTAWRNDDYRSAVAIWSDTVEKRPGNPRAHCNLGDALFLAGDATGAIAQYEAALQLKPDYGEAHYNLANTLLAAHRPAEAVTHYEAALRLRPDFATAHRNLAHALAEAGRLAESLAHFALAAELEPGNAETECAWADALTQLGRASEAIPHYEAALRARPDYAEAHNNCANALVESGRGADAKLYYEAALRVRPDYAEAHNNLGMLLADAGDFAGARTHFEAAVRARPDFAPARENLARLQAMGR